MKILTILWTTYQIVETSEDSTSYVTNKIEDGSGRTFFDAIEEIEDGEDNMGDDEDHGITYTIENLDEVEDNINKNDDEDHVITVTMMMSTT